MISGTKRKGHRKSSRKAKIQLCTTFQQGIKFHDYIRAVFRGGRGRGIDPPLPIFRPPLNFDSLVKNASEVSSEPLNKLNFLGGTCPPTPLGLRGLTHAQGGPSPPFIPEQICPPFHKILNTALHATVTLQKASQEEHRLRPNYSPWVLAKIGQKGYHWKGHLKR